MKSSNADSVWSTAARLTALLFLVCAWNAYATAPRITAQLFGEERKADIAAYQPAPAEAAEHELAVEIVTEAFKAAGKKPVLDVIPSKQLATYALTNHDVMALMGNSRDWADKDKKQYSVVVFYLKSKDDEPVGLVFSQTHGKALQKSFVDGMQKLLKSGKYLQIIEKSRGKLSADYVARLKRHNSSWK